MGNSSSQQMKDPGIGKDEKQNFENFYEVIDYIATYYILTMDFKSLSKLSEKEYCDQLVILTSDIINKYFNDLEVTYLAQRVKDGLEVNDLKKETIQFLNKAQLESLDVKNDKQKNIRKKRVCIGIAKFYIKIAHVFAAIVMTINPVYVYKDQYGSTKKSNLYEKDKIPKNVDKKIFKLNICDNRINSLNKYEESKDNKDEINLHPKVCSINADINGNVKNLSDEPGINELLQLYLDDKYDYSNGTFTGMSDNTAKQFQKDLQLFYTAFTGNKVMPPEIKKFSDIKLRDYNSKNACQGNNPSFKMNYKLSKKDKLFTDYADNIKNMIQKATIKQKELLEIINQLFSFVVDPYNNKKKVRVNPKLTDEMLQKMIENSRKIIMELYINCELDYINGIKLYEAIVESKILETTKEQINSLQKESDKIIQQTSDLTKKSKYTETPTQPSQTCVSPQQPKPYVVPQPYIISQQQQQQPYVIPQQQQPYVIPQQQQPYVYNK